MRRRSFINFSIFISFVYLIFLCNDVRSQHQYYYSYSHGYSYYSSNGNSDNPLNFGGPYYGPMTPYYRSFNPNFNQQSPFYYFSNNRYNGPPPPYRWNGPFPGPFPMNGPFSPINGPRPYYSPNGPYYSPNGPYQFNQFTPYPPRQSSPPGFTPSIPGMSADRTLKPFPHRSRRPIPANDVIHISRDSSSSTLSSLKDEDETTEPIMTTTTIELITQKPSTITTMPTTRRTRTTTTTTTTTTAKTTRTTLTTVHVQKKKDTRVTSTPIPPTTIPTFRAQVTTTCPALWNYLNATKSCYRRFKINNGIDRNNAQTECKKLGANLASIHSAVENQFVALVGRSEVKKWAFEDMAWVGLEFTKDRKLFWLDGTPVDYVNFGQFEPNGFQEYCTLMITNTIYNNNLDLQSWYDHECSFKLKNYICKMPVNKSQRITPSNESTPVDMIDQETPLTIPCDEGWDYYKKTESCYKKFYKSTGIDQVTAKKECQKQDSKLTSILSAEENIFVSLIARDSISQNTLKGWTWIGGSFDTNRKLKWEDGTNAADYANFAPGEPNHTNENCTLMITDEKYWKPYEIGQWYDQGCSDILYFYICKKKAKEDRPTRPSHLPPKMAKCPKGYWYAQQTGFCYKEFRYDDGCYASFDDVSKTCADSTGDGKAHLATIEWWFTENYLVTGVPLNSTYGWLGVKGSAKDKLKNFDGSEVKFTNFGPDSANPYPCKGQDCCIVVSMDAYSGNMGKWFLVDCKSESMRCELNIVNCKAPNLGPLL